MQPLPRPGAIPRSVSTNKQRPAFVVCYDPRLPSIPKTTTKHWRSLVEEDSYLESVFPEPPLVSYRRQKYEGDYHQGKCSSIKRTKSSEGCEEVWQVPCLFTRKWRQDSNWSKLQRKEVSMEDRKTGPSFTLKFSIFSTVWQRTLPKAIHRIYPTGILGKNQPAHWLY